MRITMHYSAGKQVVSAGGASVDLLRLCADEATMIRSNVIRSRFGSEVAERFINAVKPTRKAA